MLFGPRISSSYILGFCSILWLRFRYHFTLRFRRGSMPGWCLRFASPSSCLQCCNYAHGVHFVFRVASSRRTCEFRRFIRFQAKCFSSPVSPQFLDQFTRVSLKICSSLSNLRDYCDWKKSIVIALRDLADRWKKNSEKCMFEWFEFGIWPTRSIWVL